MVSGPLLVSPAITTPGSSARKRSSFRRAGASSSVTNTRSAGAEITSAPPQYAEEDGSLREARPHFREASADALHTNFATAVRYSKVQSPWPPDRSQEWAYPAHCPAPEARVHHFPGLPRYIKPAS